MPVDLRAITDDEFEEFHRVEGLGFGEPVPSPESIAANRAVFELDRSIVAVEDGAMVGTTIAFTFAMTVPGGATLPVAGVSGVTVSATHRRRGILRSMMAHQLATFFASWRIDTVRSAFRRPVRTDLRLRIIPQDQAREVVAPIYDAWRMTRPGAVSQSMRWWDGVLGSHEMWRGGGKLFVVVCDADEQQSGGFAVYTVDKEANPGHWRLDLRLLFAADPEVEARLWRYVLDVDLVETVVVDARPVDDPLRWRLLDPRQVKTDEIRDCLFVRILDVERALATRRYPVTDSLVLDVHDAFRPEVAGRHRVEGGPAGASCTRVTDDEPADLELDVAELGSLYLGGVSAHELAAAGLLVEHTPGAVDRATRFFGWPVAPFCSTNF